MATTKEYANDEITIVWKPEMCIHSANCVNGLPLVFDNEKRPWIDANGSSSKEIIAQVAKCPSGALSIKSKVEVDQIMREVRLLENGPLMLVGNVKILDANGEMLFEKEKCALCRCGASQNKPFCDGSHVSTNFKS